MTKRKCSSSTFKKRITIDFSALVPLIVFPPDRVTGGELFDRIVEKGSYSEKDAADLIKQVKGKLTIKLGQTSSKTAGSF